MASPATSWQHVAAEEPWSCTSEVTLVRETPNTAIPNYWTSPAMKLTTGVLASALGCCAHLAAAASGRVYTYDPVTSSSREAVRSELDPATARLVLAHRAGVEDYHIETALREDEIEQINKLGSKTPLFGGKDRLRKLFILALDDAEGSEGKDCCIRGFMDQQY